MDKNLIGFLWHNSNISLSIIYLSGSRIPLTRWSC